MIKNTSKADAKYLAVQNVNAPSLDDVGNVRAAVEANSKTPTYGPFRVKEDDSGFLFLSSKLVDKRQAPSAYTASATGKDRDMAHDFLKAMCDVISGDTNNSDQVVRASDELALHIHNTQPKRGAQRTVDDTPPFRQKLIALDKARKAQNREREQQTTKPTPEARHDKRKATLETFRKPLPFEDGGVELEAHTPDVPSHFNEGITSAPQAQGGRKLRNRRQTRQPASDSTVHVDKALGGYMTSNFLLTLSQDTERRLVEKARQGTPLDRDELERLFVAREVQAARSPQTTNDWNPMTEIRLEVDLPPNYFLPRK